MQQKWLHTCSHRPFSPSVSSVENNQHHCWLVRLLIGLLPDTRPFQRVVTRGRCSTRWPWETEGIAWAELPPQGLQSANKISEGMSHTADTTATFPDLPCCWQGCSVRTSRWEMWVHGLFNQDFHRGRSLSQWVTPAHELIAGKSISRSTHWANWVPVFVWDNGEGVPPYQLRRVRDALWLVAVWAHSFRFWDERLSFCPSTVKIWDTGHN